MNVAFRAVHDALADDGNVADRWRSFVLSLPDGQLDVRDLDVAVRGVGIRGRGAAWGSKLRRLGVLDADDKLDRQRASEVETALQIAADSFVLVKRAETWAPVATLPAELRPIMRPHPVRQTAGLFLEIIDGAVAELLLAAPYLDRRAVEFVTDALVAAGARNVDVVVLTSAGRGGQFTEIASRWTRDCSGGLSVFEISTDSSALGSHAKVLIADRQRAYVGSANLTAAGLSRQVEIGVEVLGAQTVALAELLVGLERLGVRAAAVPRSGDRRRRD